jgi:hypothetical protein
MPRKSDWLLRLPTIQRELQQLSVPVVDRSMIESVFQVGRRRAIQLLHCFGGYQSGRTFLLDRNSLLRALASLESGDEFSMEFRRKERLSSELDRLREFTRAARVSVPVAPGVYDTRLNSLPPGVHLESGRLTVEYGSPEQLLERLFALSQALLNDLEQFRMA